MASIHTVRLLDPLAGLIDLLDSDSLDDSRRARHRSYSLLVPVVRVSKQVACSRDYYLRVGRHRSRYKLLRPQVSVCTSDLFGRFRPNRSSAWTAAVSEALVSFSMAAYQCGPGFSILISSAADDFDRSCAS